MNLGRVAGINIFRKVRQFEAIKPGLLVQRCNPQQFSISASNLANLKHCVIPHASNYSRSHILSQLPAQLIVGVSQSRSASTQGDHVRLWIIERMVAASFLLLIPAALLFENKFVDVILAAAIVMHTHWGLEAIILDYIRPMIVGTLVPKVAFLMLNLLSVATLAGLLVLIYNGPGLTKIIKQGWAIDKKPKTQN